MHQKLLNLAVLNRLHIQDNTPAQYCRQKRIYIRRENQYNHILRRLLQCFQQSILGLNRHLLALIHNINFLRAAVRFNCHSPINLTANILHSDGSRLLMGNKNNIRLVASQSLLTGMAFLAWFNPLPALTLQSHCKGFGYKFFSGIFLPINNISMRYLIHCYGILQMLL